MNQSTVSVSNSVESALRSLKEYVSPNDLSKFKICTLGFSINPNKMELMRCGFIASGEWEKRGQSEIHVYVPYHGVYEIESTVDFPNDSVPSKKQKKDCCELISMIKKFDKSIKNNPIGKDGVKFHGAIYANGQLFHNIKSIEILDNNFVQISLVKLAAGFKEIRTTYRLLASNVCAVVWNSSISPFNELKDEEEK